MPAGFAVTKDVFAITRRAYKGYRFYVLLFVVVGLIAQWFYLRKFEAPCYLLVSIGASSSVWQLSPEGVDLLIASQEIVFWIMVLWVFLSCIAAWLIRSGPLPCSLFSLRLTSKDIRYFPRGDSPQVWKQKTTFTFRHRDIYFSSAGDECYIVRPEKRNCIGVHLTPLKNKHGEYELAGDSWNWTDPTLGEPDQEEYERKPLEIGDNGERNVRPDHSFKLGEHKVEFDFVSATWEG